jgi:ABC-type glycerol-3-phosphate transport system substrate-binding protein
MVHSDGEIYAIPWMNFIANIDFCLMFRQDWLDLYGLEVPKTINEYYDFVMMCVNGDPRGDGETVYAFGGTDGLSDARFQDHIFGAFGALPGEWQLVDGVLTSGTIMPGTKEALKFINKLWNEGAIDPEFITDDWAKCMDKVNRGYYAAISGRTHAFWSSSNYWNLLRENVPEASWTYADPLVSYFTDKPMGPRQLTRRGWLKTVVHADTEKIDTVMKYLDFLATEPAAEVVLCGIEGETFTRNADGTIKNLYGDADAPQWGIAMMTLARWDLASRYTPLYVDVMNKIKPTAHPALVDSFVIDEVAEYQAELNDYQSRMLTQFAVGEADIETGWDDFVQEWLRRGGQELGDAYNREYQARN